MNNKNIITAAISVAIIHFILTSVMGHYIAVQIGTQMGQVVAEGLIEAYEKSPQSLQKSEEEGKRISQDMKNKRDHIVENWKIPSILISLPIKRLMNPILSELRKNELNKVIAKEISREQFRTRGLIIDYTVNFLNSLSFGLLIYIMLRIFNQYRRKR